MKKRFLQIGILVLFILSSFLLVACGSDSEKPSSSDFKVGLIMVGPKNDGAWNEAAYNGLLEMKELYGAEILFNENTVMSDYNKIIRDYAKDGCQVIIAHSYEFKDAVDSVAPDFPDTAFLITTSDYAAKLGNGTNVAGIIGDGLQQGFLQGVTAASLTKSNVIAGVGGLEIPAIKFTLDGYKAGALYTNPAVEVKTALTGSFEDVNALKEQSLTLINQKADVVMSVANIAGRGAYEAANEKPGTFAIGSIGISDFDKYPDTLVACAQVDMANAIIKAVDKVRDGTFEGIDYISGIADGSVDIYFNPNMKDKIPSDLEAKIDEIKQKIMNGEINIADYVK